MNLNDTETQVLAFLATGNEDFGGYCFAPIVDHTKLDRAKVRRACRGLKRKGLAEFHRGMWTEDGEPYGSGYSATKEGRGKADATLVEKYSLELWP